MSASADDQSDISSQFGVFSLCLVNSLMCSPYILVHFFPIFPTGTFLHLPDGLIQNRLHIHSASLTVSIFHSFTFFHITTVVDCIECCLPFTFDSDYPQSTSLYWVSQFTTTKTFHHHFIIRNLQISNWKSCFIMFLIEKKQNTSSTKTQKICGSIINFCSTHGTVYFCT